MNTVDGRPRGEALRWLLLASYGSVVVAVLLILAKAVAWWLGGSVSLLGSLLDSVMDSMASVINALAVRYALVPADDEHRFGHGKAEFLAALAQSGFILASAAMLLVHCVGRLVEPQPEPITHTGLGVAVTLFSLACTLVLVSVQARAIRLTGSTAIRADSLHYRSDILLNATVVIALLGSVRYPVVDAALGGGIALYIARGAWQIGLEAFHHLMDRELPPEVDREILALCEAQPGVSGVHGLRTRRSGHHYLIQLHLEFPDDTPLLAAHEIADGVETAIRARFPGADVMIHQDPESVAAAERETQGMPAA